MTDPYEALGLTSSATDAEIKAAFRKLTRKLHPDLYPGDAKAVEAFKTVSVAYDLLGDPEKRRRFDAGEIAADGSEKPQRRYYRDFADAPENPYQQDRGFRAQGFGADVDPADIFAELLRRQSGRGRGFDETFEQGFGPGGQDQHFRLKVRFLDAVRGGKLPVTLPDGRALEITIPPGAEDGQTLRLRGKEPSAACGGPAGDLLVTLAVASHRLFRRRGNDILITLPITLDEAVLGGKIATPTIKGTVNLSIPKGASSGQILRLRGRGIAAGGAPAGDQLVELRIVAPKVIDDELAAFMERWRKTARPDPRKELYEEDKT